MHFELPADIVLLTGLIREYDQFNIKVSKYRHWCTTRREKKKKEKYRLDILKHLHLKDFHY